MPIFRTRLVADSGWSMNGGAAQVGKVGVTIWRRSATSWRARSKSVPGSKIIRIDDSCSTDLLRNVVNPSSPASACSRGIVTSVSTSEVDIPIEIVWTSTRGGANSGKTSTGTFCIWTMPMLIIAAAAASTRNR